MSDSDDFFEFEEDIDDFQYLFQRKIPVSLRTFAKDVEISTRMFILLAVSLFSINFLVFAQLGLDQQLANRFDYYPRYNAILWGTLIGLFIAIVLLDRFKEPIKTLELFLVISIGLTILTMLFSRSYIFFPAYMLIISNIVFLLFCSSLLFKIFLIKTTILERGRVFAYLFILNLLALVLIMITSVLGLLFLIPIAIVIGSIIYLELQRKRIQIIFPTLYKWQRKLEFNKNNFKYYVFFGMFSFTAGFATHLELSVEVLSTGVAGDIVAIIMIIILISIITALILGVTFDYGGRMSALSLMILIIAISTYLSIFRFAGREFPIAVIFSGYVAAVMAVPLLVGDIAEREHYGRSLAISYLLLGFGITFGWSLRNNILSSFENDLDYAYNIIYGTTFMGCLICFALLVIMRETLPSKEQDWKDSLLHIYIIHQSGILLFEYAYVKDNDEHHPDLISGGIVGIKNIMKEIVRGEKEIRTIDHGDRKIMFKTNTYKDVIFALLVKQELIVLRKKMDSLIDDFDKYYRHIIKNIDNVGLDMESFKNLKYNVRRYFGY